MNRSISWATGLLMVALSWQDLFAGARTKITREFLEKTLSKFGREAMEEGIEKVGQRLGRLVAKLGPNAVKTFENTGLKGLMALEAAGSQASQLAGLLARHGKEAAWLVARPSRTALILRHGEEAAAVLLRHRQVGDVVLQKLGQPAVKALVKIDGRNGRRMAMLLEEGKIFTHPASNGLLKVIGTYGDRAMDFVWRHKGALTISTFLIAFVSNPKPFLEGVCDLAQVAGTTAIHPVTVGVREAARNVNWTVVVLAILIMTMALFWIRRTGGGKVGSDR